VKGALKFRTEKLLVFQNRALNCRVIYVKFQEFIQHIIEHLNPANRSEKIIFFSANITNKTDKFCSVDTFTATLICLKISVMCRSGIGNQSR